ncbi:hypothetical protein GCM10007111_38480 [Virgibacillus kapii]|uniref:Uncharacterized protein n=3 Tax=Bacillaceae TaxID=186817 RepID=A0A024Q9F3_9BACI|nr:hypothetical protein M948_05045 [Virgibacillus sp. CM-4]GGJ73212.1 hypothetical protein GCM10007111_38480 [Virgibacillus kapii]CDQ38551.1 hypothetical protein BN990_00822 [Virgibacillus massiliensis]
MYLLVHSKKKIRTINMRNHNVLIIHLLTNKKDTLVQSIDGSNHHFSFLGVKDGIGQLLREHARMEDTEISVDGWQPIQLPEELFDEFHTSPAPALQAMAADQKQPKPIREFVSALLANGQEFDNISFMKSSYVKDQSAFDDIHFFLPVEEEDYIWHLDYQEIESARRVTLQPIPVRSYFQEIERATIAYFTEE